jgi:monoamine oxidase
MRRREFLKRGALATAALSVPLPGLFASSQQKLERKGHARKVLIIGAWLAGLSAAYGLTQAGHDVTVFEAQTRPGGRVLTLRAPFSDGLYAEAGAMFIPDSHYLTIH